MYRNTARPRTPSKRVRDFGPEIAFWLSRWDEDDLRRECYTTFGAVIRRPCIAALLVSGVLLQQHEVDAILGFLPSALRIDLGPEDVTELLLRWNRTCRQPLRDEEVVRASKEQDSYCGCMTLYKVLSQFGTTSLYCFAWKEGCPYYLDHFGPDLMRLQDANSLLALSTSGHLKHLSGNAVRLYAGICLLEVAKGARPGQKLALPFKTAEQVSGVGHSTVRARLEELAARRLVIVEEWGQDTQQGKATIVRRVIPIPLCLPFLPDGPFVDADAYLKPSPPDQPPVGTLPETHEQEVARHRAELERYWGDDV